jgi:RraA family protein
VQRREAAAVHCIDVGAGGEGVTDERDVGVRGCEAQDVRRGVCEEQGDARARRHQDRPRRRDVPRPEAALEERGAGRVLVVDGGASLRRALVGGNIAAGAAKNGWAGIVVDGCVRDSAELAAADVGIRALGLMPLPTDRKNQGLRDVVVQIQGVTVRPGEWLVADEDGIVVLPSPV